MDSRLEKVFELLPHRCDSIFIAGGAAVNYDLASDIDLIFGGKNGLKTALKFKESLPFWRDCKTEYASNQLNLVADGYHPDIDKTIQILWSKDKTAAEVINKFDISVHAAAWTSKGDYFASEDAGIVDVRFPFSNHKTFSRYLKLCKRYLQPVDLSILEKLSSKVEVKKDIPKISDLSAAITPEFYETLSKVGTIAWDSETAYTGSLKNAWEKLYSLYGFEGIWKNPEEPKK